MKAKTHAKAIEKWTRERWIILLASLLVEENKILQEDIQLFDRIVGLSIKSFYLFVI